MRQFGTKNQEYLIRLFADASVVKQGCQRQPNKSTVNETNRWGVVNVDSGFCWSSQVSEPVQRAFRCQLRPAQPLQSVVCSSWWSGRCASPELPSALPLPPASPVALRDLSVLAVQSCDLLKCSCGRPVSPDRHAVPLPTHPLQLFSLHPRSQTPLPPTPNHHHPDLYNVKGSLHPSVCCLCVWLR